MKYLYRIAAYIPLFWLDVAVPVVVLFLAALVFFGVKKKYIYPFSLVFLCLFCGVWGAHPQGGTEYAFSGGIVFSCLAVSCITLCDILGKAFRRAREKKREKMKSETHIEPCKAEGTTLITPRENGGMPATNGDLQLDHALSVLGKLAGKKLSVTDKMDTDVMRNMIHVYRCKDTLSAEETRTLNNYLGTLLKLMSKYSV